MNDRWTTRTALLAVPVLALLAPPADGPLAPLLRLVSAGAWLITTWLLALVALTAVSRVPGALGRAASRAVRWTAPPAVRALVGVALGTALATTVLPAPGALAEDRTPTVAGSSAGSLDWPGLAPRTASPATAPPATPPPATPPPATPPPATPPPATPPPATATPPATTSPDVVVASGDSLWSLARQRLGAPATDQQVAQAWPHWWQANRTVIGDDPDLLHPGDRLTAPSTPPETLR